MHCIINETGKCVGGGDDGNNDNDYDSSVMSGIASHISWNRNITNRNIP